MYSSRALWVDDRFAVRCRRCDARFNMIRRRHHCRHCGQVFCGDCLLVPSATLVYNLVTDVISSLTGFQHESITKVCHECDSILRQRGRIVSEDRSIFSLPRRALAQAPAPNAAVKAVVAGASHRSDLSENVDTVTATTEMGMGVVGVSLGSSRSSETPGQMFSGGEDVLSSLCKGKNSSLRVMDPVQSVTPEAQMVRLPTHKETASEQEISSGLTDVPVYTLNSMSEWLRKLHLRAQVRLNSKVPKQVKKVFNRPISTPIPKATFKLHTGLLGPNSLCNIFSPPVEEEVLLFLEKQCSKHLIRRAARLFRESEMLLSRVGTERIEWIARICDLSWRVVSHVAVVLNEHVEKHFEVICIPGDAFTDTDLIPGVAFVQTVASKRMKTSVKAPSILLLAGDVGTAVNQRVDFTEYMEGYKGFLDKQYERIHVWRPSVIVVEGNMHHYLQDKIIYHSYATLILNAGEAAIQRLSRCCNASVIHDLQYVGAVDLQNSAMLGTCDTFQVVHMGHKSLCIFSGLQVPLFATVLLRGDDEELLEAGKQFLISCTRTAYHLSLQAHCMLDLGIFCGVPTFSSSLLGAAAGEDNDKNVKSSRLPFTNEKESVSNVEIEEYMQLISSLPQAKDRLETLSMNIGMMFPEEMAHMDEEYDKMMMDNIIVNTVFLDSVFNGGGVDDGVGTAPNYSVRQSREVLPFYDEGDETFLNYLSGRVKEGDSTRLIVHGNKRIWVKTRTDFNNIHAFRFSSEQGASSFRSAAAELCVSSFACGGEAGGGHAPPLRGYATCKECHFGGKEGGVGGGTSTSLSSGLCSLHMLNLSWGSFLELLIYGSSFFMSCGHGLGNNAYLSFVLSHHTGVEVNVTINVEPVIVYNLISPSLTMPPCGDVAKLYLESEVKELRRCIEEINAVIYTVIKTLATQILQPQQHHQSHSKSLRHPFSSIASTCGSGAGDTSGISEEKGAQLLQRAEHFLAKLSSSETLESVALLRLDYLVDFVCDFLEWYNASVSIAERRIGRGSIVVDTTKFEDPYWAHSLHNRSAVRLNEPTCLVALAIQATRLCSGTQFELPKDTVSTEVLQGSVMSTKSNLDGIEASFPTDESQQLPTAKSMEVMLGIETSVSPGTLASASLIRSASDALDILTGRSSVTTRTFKHVMDLLIPWEKGGHVTVTVEVMFPVQFVALQYLFSEGRVAELVLSLSRCRAFKPQGGKTKSDFFLTLDERFMLKQIKQAELIHFAEFGPHYFAHMGRIYTEALNGDAGTHPTQLRSALGKVLGIYSVHVKGRKRFAETPAEIRYFALMENVFFSRRVDITYDLKGSQRNRTAPEGSSVLLDQDFVGSIKKGTFFYCTNGDKSLLMDSLTSDAHLLSISSIMDYSLVVALNHEKRELYLGIVDYLHPYSGAKAIESKVKAGLETVLGVPGRDPTIIDPTNYRNRFARWLSGCFCSVPEKTFAAKHAEANTKRRRKKQTTQ